MIWSLVPKEIRYIDSLEKLQNKFRRWKPNDCSCCICKIYVSDVGFLEIFQWYFKCKIAFSVLIICKICKIFLWLGSYLLTRVGNLYMLVIYFVSLHILFHGG